MQVKALDTALAAYNEGLRQHQSMVDTLADKTAGLRDALR